MSKTYVQEGKTIDYSNSGSDLTSGSVVVVGARIAILAVDIPAGTDGSASVTGVHLLPKATGTAWSQGDALYWDASAGNLTKTSSSNTTAGWAFVAAASGDATGYVRLPG